MALELNLTKNTNEQLEGTLGKYYARVRGTSPMVHTLVQ